MVRWSFEIIQYLSLNANTNLTLAKSIGKPMWLATKCRAGLSWKWLTLLLLVCAGLTPYLAAQNPRGTLRGVVQDSSGARIANAKVTVESAGLSAGRRLETSERGEFRVDGLLPGAYRVRVEAADFQVAESRVVVQVSSGRDIDVVLKPTGGHQEANVSGEASSIP